MAEVYLEPFRGEAIRATVFVLVVAGGSALGLLVWLFKVMRRRDARRLEQFRRGGER